MRKAHMTQCRKLLAYDLQMAGIQIVLFPVSDGLAERGFCERLEHLLAPGSVQSTILSS